ncbi:MEDS domain-containing protein [Actinoplanes sp. CA-030573]|uniref:MEDS domain-containing protein n=1 Tax=Actinoplanes sp. CA-030573 TaxID=3239898 RepID=UPI003D8A0955
MTGEAAHTCWSYDDQRAFEAYARAYLADGLARGEQVWYVPGERSTGVVDGWLSDIGGRPGSARVVRSGDAYAAGQVIDPAGQVAAYTAATERAIADGFTGLRVCADCTPLVRTTAQLDAFARYEYAIGGYMRVAPMRAVCAYDRRELGERAVAELAGVHRHSNAGVPFRLHASGRPGVAILDGEVDAAGEELFVTALRRSGLGGPGNTEKGKVGEEVVIDARGSGFVDHRALMRLQRHASECAVTVVLRTGRPSVRRLAGLLELSRVVVEIVA